MFELRKQKYLFPGLLGFTVLFLSFFDCLPAESWARIWEETLELPTYLAVPADKNPIFYSGRAYQGAQGRIYPYPIRDRLSRKKETRGYRAVYLENPYIKLCLLPQLGGRIFSAIDKSNNYDFFYRQSVIKPALIGMLGAWISGGVEWNFPHHHRASNFMPMDYVLKENTDGSKTVWLAETEIRHRMRWLLAITIYPDRSIIDVRIRIINRTPQRQSFLCWANVAVHTNMDYQVIFPPSTRFATHHGKNQFSRWPISNQVYGAVDYSEGVDVSLFRNHPKATSMFAHQVTEDFLAGYDHGRRAGVVHVASHHRVPGKKFWTWGTGPRSRQWERNLTDSDGPYIELMVGAYSDNQPDYSWIRPYEVKEVRQVWYPLREIGGVKNATEEGAVFVKPAGPQRVRLGFNTSREYKNARVRLFLAKLTLFSDRITIGPDRPFLREIDLPGGIKNEEVCAELLSSSGETLVEYYPERVGEAAPMPAPVKAPPLPRDVSTVEELYLTGRRLQQFYHPTLSPGIYFDEALRRDPGNYRINTMMGINAFRDGRMVEAERHLKLAVERVTRFYTRPLEGEALYYLAQVYKFQRKFSLAEEMFQRSAWDGHYYANSHFALAEVACQTGDSRMALDHLDRSLAANGLNPNARVFRAALLRRYQRLDESARELDRVMARDPLNHWALFEQLLAASPGVDPIIATEIKKRFINTIRDDPQSYLELAVDYGNCGLYEEAVKVLKTALSRVVPALNRSPLIHYYLGYFSLLCGKDLQALSRFKQAGNCPADYCFPYRRETRPVLEAALAAVSDDSLAWYLLGNLRYESEPEAAIRAWERSRQEGGVFATVFRNLALAYARVEHNLEKASTSMEMAISIDPADARLYVELDQLYELQGAAPEKRLTLFEANHDVVAERDDALSREISLLIFAGRAKRAIELLDNHHFFTWEGGGGIHRVYVDAHLVRGLNYVGSGSFQEAISEFKAALEYPENLEVGRSLLDPNAARIYYYLGLVQKRMGDGEAARISFEKSLSVELGSRLSEHHYFQALARVELDQIDAARVIFKELFAEGERQLQARSNRDFFAKFGERLNQKNRLARAHYLIGLGQLGLGNKSMAGSAFRKALTSRPDHLWSSRLLAGLESRKR